MARDFAAEPEFPAKDIQGDILVGLPKRHEHLMFFQITDRAKFVAFLKVLEITSAQECLDKKAAIAAAKARKDHTTIPTPGLNVAFSFKGLQTLAVPGLPAGPVPDPAQEAILKPFRQGMAASRAALADPPQADWKILRQGDEPDGVFIVTGATHAEVVDIISLRLVPPQANGFRLRHEEVGQVRPEPVRGHEHFGYADGVSQPGVRGTVNGKALTPTVDGGKDTQGGLGQDLLWPGEFVFGYPGQNFDPARTDNTLEEKGPIQDPPIPFMNNGAFLVFRRLAQQVPEFNASVKAAAAAIPAGPDTPDATLLGAQLVGRWKSGAPLILAPQQDDPNFAENTARANDFEFGDDREGLKCPWAAHVRKAYPRDDVRHKTNPPAEPAHDIPNAEAFTQTHRMMRRGIAFGPEVTEEEALQQRSAGGPNTRGLLFKCYVTSLADQFEFVQQQWVNAADFSQENSGVDAIIGQPAGTAHPFLGAAPFSGNAANKPQLSLKSFVQMEGGGYFFSPSIPALRGL